MDFDCWFGGVLSVKPAALGARVPGESALNQPQLLLLLPQGVLETK